MEEQVIEPGHYFSLLGLAPAIDLEPSYSNSLFFDPLQDSLISELANYMREINAYMPKAATFSMVAFNIW